MRSTETEFNMEKNALSEITGRLDVGLDKIQLGLMYYSQRTKKMLGFSLRDQSNKKPFFIGKTQQLPYMPYLRTPLVSAILQSNQHIFSIKRDENVPRIAVIFNDQSSDEPLSQIAQEANNLKNQGVEIFVVAIGNYVDINQLNAIASSPNNIIRVQGHQFIYEKISEITEKICKVNSQVYLGREESINLSENDFRYFKLSFPVGIEYLEIEVNEFNGLTDVYYSFSFQNPTYENSDNMFRKVTKRGITSSFLVDVPSNTNLLYFTVHGIDKMNEIKFVVRQIDL
jgi:hypothetical protein